MRVVADEDDRTLERIERMNKRFAGIDVEIKDILTTSVTQRHFP